jgi:hypothetical protein
MFGYSHFTFGVNFSRFGICSKATITQSIGLGRGYECAVLTANVMNNFHLHVVRDDDRIFRYTNIARASGTDNK